MIYSFCWDERLRTQYVPWFLLEGPGACVWKKEPREQGMQNASFLAFRSRKALRWRECLQSQRYLKYLLAQWPCYMQRSLCCANYKNHHGFPLSLLPTATCHTCVRCIPLKSWTSKVAHSISFVHQFRPAALRIRIFPHTRHRHVGCGHEGLAVSNCRRAPVSQQQPAAMPVRRLHAGRRAPPQALRSQPICSLSVLKRVGAIYIQHPKQRKNITPAKPSSRVDSEIETYYSKKSHNKNSYKGGRCHEKNYTVHSSNAFGVLHCSHIYHTGHATAGTGKRQLCSPPNPMPPCLLSIKKDFQRHGSGNRATRYSKTPL